MKGVESKSLKLKRLFYVLCYVVCVSTKLLAKLNTSYLFLFNFSSPPLLHSLVVEILPLMNSLMNPVLHGLLTKDIYRSGRHMLRNMKKIFIYWGA